jgi:sarcosine oxidase
MPRSFDVAVIGLGAMGSAASRALSRRGLKVLGLDRFAPPHTFGSTHGDARIIREAYFEHPAYVPLVQRAYLLWEELEREAAKRLWIKTGGLMVGPREGVLVSGALASADQHRLPYELLDAEKIRARFPAFHPDDAMVGVWEPRAGVLFPEACVSAFLDTARRHGATIRGDETVKSWARDGDGVRIETDRGRHHAARVVLTAGPWNGGLLNGLALPLAVERVVQFWFDPSGDRTLFAPERCPVSIWEHEVGRFFYGFPLLERGVKLAIHHEGETTDPDRVRRAVGPEEVGPLRILLDRYIPAADGPLAAASVCMYTNTPDSHFVIGPHPTIPQALIVSPCSGHGFKFAPVIGEIVSDLVVEGWTRHDLGMFGVTRWK